MRDLLWFDPSAPAEPFEADPVKRTQNALRRDLPKRFWTEVAVEAVAPDRHRILLDGRPVKTPAKREIAVPHDRLAEAVAAEWRAQGQWLDPATMPLTRLVNAVVDGVVDRAREVAEDAVRYAGSDLLCYRAEAPARLVERQTLLWDPLLDWLEETRGVRLLVAEGIVHVRQEPEAIDVLLREALALDPWRLAALHTLTTLTGSFVVALARLEGRLDGDGAWRVAHVDEDWNAELWGRDEEAEQRLERRRVEYDAACFLLECR